ncbi:LysR family transcriptional regulator [Novosphingobium sp. AP12]|uniref:LysR family transcriptional regulator n=1 Tax=Novosphingobium sp. AP12 TaxID=1144305 RepID=UPI000271FB28|nr:LysR family transcriptional regulator [Novosphingobium sp. AP12]EJL28925.1 transcriptional regulator [Novosphingobium sp. AP12]
MQRTDMGGLAMFIAVAEERSFTKAATKLGISQSALSHSIRRLEQRLDLRLLTRTTRSVSLTEAGERLMETVAPAFEKIDAKIVTLTELRTRPAGTVRISTSEHAARTLLWPAVDRITREHPDVKVELNIQSGLTDIVAERYDAGVRLGERLDQDMVAVRIGPRLRMATVGSPDYFGERGIPAAPADLTHHACINLRMAGGSIYQWEYEKDGRELKVKADGQLVLNDVDLILKAVLAGHGIAHLVEDRVAPLLEDGSLVRVLEDWCDPFDGYYLYYPSRRQPSAAFSLLLGALRYRE